MIKSQLVILCTWQQKITLVKLDNIIIRIFAIRTDPNGDQNIVVELPQFGNGFLPIKGLIVPISRWTIYPSN